MQDYNKVLEKTIEELNGEVPNLLLHSCCAPCSSHVIDTLKDYFDITIFYYNPNIEPYDEYLLRKNEQKKYIEMITHKNKLDILDCDYDNDLFKSMSKDLENEKEGGRRCFKCYELRLLKTASIAKELGYDYFGTTLTVSPFKNSQKLNEIGNDLSLEYKINYLFSDFKKKNGYKHSIELSKKYNLYRQDYCGCVYSKRDRELQVNKNV